MVDTIIKVAGIIPANTTTNDIASIDVPEDGLIMCMGGAIVGQYDLSDGVAVTNGSLELAAELSFLSTNQIGVNDSRGSIAGLAVSAFRGFGEAAETGGVGAKLSEMLALCVEGGIHVNAGERIHLHGSSSETSLTALVTFVLYMKTKGGGRRDGRRR